MKLHTRIFAGFAAGTLAGLAVNALASSPSPEGVPALAPWADWTVRNLADPAGKIFLRLLLMLVVPLVVTSLIAGVSGLGDLRKLGRVGARTLGLTVVVSGASVFIGLGLANLVRPGERVPTEVRERLFGANRSEAQRAVAGAEQGAGGKPAAQAVVELVPDNPFASAARTPPDMLALMVFSIVVGIALAGSGEKGRAFAGLLDSVLAVLQRAVGLVMGLAPFGVAALLFAMSARFGLGVLRGLAAFVLTVLFGLGLQLFLVYPLLLKALARVSPREFLRRTREVLATAFATSSSSATLPTALRCAEERLRLPREISSFVLTVGATANQNGTALYEGVTVLFLAQLFGVELSLGQQVLLLGMAIAAGVGTAGVPSGSLPFIVVILQTVGVPPEGIGIILGVDRLLDMCRTVPNVAGDLVLATLVARGEGAEVMGPEPTSPRAD